MNSINNFSSVISHAVSAADIAAGKQLGEIIIYTLGAIFIVIAIVSFVFSYIFYKKKSADRNDLNPIWSKSKSFWVKYRANGFLVLGVLFTLLAVGGFSSAGSIINSFGR
ncbi:MPN207a family PTS transporter accessory protein [[Mycoplasma] testudinis]|uniref:MPN207a family PTS transporter accessory protein n=1 Tax=[Mycoplasma] testudinis TaxID=33924 RepID=UPI00047F074A|nr:hypothetical protein [[Mycoplasma] testudinis]